MSETVEKADNLSAVLYGANDLRLEQRPIPKAGPGQVLVRVHVVGICGTDLHHLVQGGNCGEMVKSPMVLGHEASGVIEEVGDGVNGFAKGQSPIRYHNNSVVATRPNPLPHVRLSPNYKMCLKHES